MSNSAALRDAHPQIDSAFQQADTHRSAQSYDEALKEFSKAIHLIDQKRKMDRTLQFTKGRCHFQIGKIHLAEDRLDEAHTDISRAAGIFETLDIKIDLAKALNTMGDIELRRDNAEAAMDFYRQSTRVLKDAGENAFSGISMVNWAAALADLGEENQAMRKLKAGVNLASVLDSKKAYSQVLGKAAEVCRSLGKEEDLNLYLERRIQVLEALVANAPEHAETAEPVQQLSQNDQIWQEKFEELQHRSAEELRHFTRKAAHDMKEPLRMISSFGGLLKRQYSETLGEGGNEYIDIIMDANTRMQQLLVKLLEYVKVGTVERAPESLAMSDIILLASNLVKNQIERKNAVIESGNLPEVTAHREYLVQLFARLIDNGVLYNNSSRPVIRIEAETRTKEHLIKVSDNGIGIEKNNWDKVYELFLRLQGREDYPGSGIGLATVKKILDLYGGKIWLESIPGKGTTFYIALPKAG